MVKIKSIQTGFSEWSNANNKTFTDFASANKAFVDWTFETPKDRGYYKTDVLFTWEDGTEFKGRYDIASDSIDLTEHLRSHCEIYSGRLKPAHMSNEEWVQFRRVYVEPRDKWEKNAFLINLLDNYQMK